MNVFFGIIIAIAVGIFGYNIAMTVSCYNSGDPNSMACFMISDRVEVGYRSR